MAAPEAFGGFAVPIGQHFVDLLERLGYDSHLKVVSEDRYNAAINDPSQHVQVDAFAVAVVITPVLGACAGDDSDGASQGTTKLANPTQTLAATGGAGTGPAETGPAVTGPTATEPTVSLGAAWYKVDFPEEGGGLPPEGVVPSTPEEREVVAQLLDGFPEACRPPTSSTCTPMGE